MTPTEKTMAQINAIYNLNGHLAFNMALQVLFDNGVKTFTAAFIAREKKIIRKETPSNSVLSASFKCGLLDIAYELSHFKLSDILLYIKLYLWIQGDDLVQLEAADYALSSFCAAALSKEHKKAVEDPEMRKEILRLMVKNHQASFTDQEVRTAIQLEVEVERQEEQ